MKKYWLCPTILAIDSCMDIPDHMTAEKIRAATLDYEHLWILAEHVLCCWASAKAEVQMGLHLHWLLRDENAIIDIIP